MQLRLLSPRLAILPSGHEGFFRGHNNSRLELVGVVASILALPLSPMGWIHAIGKMSFHSFAFQYLFIIIVSIILLFFLVSTKQNRPLSLIFRLLSNLEFHRLWACWDAILQSCWNYPQQMALAIMQLQKQSLHCYRQCLCQSTHANIKVLSISQGWTSRDRARERGIDALCCSMLGPEV